MFSTLTVSREPSGLLQVISTQQIRLSAVVQIKKYFLKSKQFAEIATGTLSLIIKLETNLKS